MNERGGMVEGQPGHFPVQEVPTSKEFRQWNLVSLRRSVYLLPIMRLASVFVIILFAAGCGRKAEQSPSVAPSASPAANAQSPPDEGQNSLPATPSTREQVNTPAAPAPDANPAE